MGVEPTRPFGQGILSPQRLPFRHSAFNYKALLIKDLIAVFYPGLQSATSFNSMLKAAIVLVTHPAKPDRAAVFRAGWLCPAITLYGDITVLQENCLTNLSNSGFLGVKSQ